MRLSLAWGVCYGQVNNVEGFDPELFQAIIGTIRHPLVVLNGDLRIIIASKAFYKKFHTDYENAHDKLFYELGEGRWDIPELRELLEKVLPERKVVEDYEIEHEFKGLGRRVIRFNAQEIHYPNGQRKMLLSIEDVTERTMLMRQKDILLKEMRHRIANSLQLIASIILLKAGSVQSAESKQHLEDAHDRILSIATVQRNLDPTGDDSEVPVVEYLTTLCNSLARSMIGGRKPIALTVSGTPGTVTPDEAIGMGLITTELVINCLKHAFPEGEGDITVVYTVNKRKKSWNLTISDNGVGLKQPEFITDGLGTNIIDTLCNQLRASIERSSSSRGTTVSISYPRPVSAANPLS